MVVVAVPSFFCQMFSEPDVLVCRSEYEISEEMKAKIALFCNVPVNHVLQNLDVEYLYEAPLAMEKEHLAQVVCESLQLPCPEPDLTDWKQMVEDLRNPIHEVEIAMVGKYIQLHDAYLSVVEALKHGGIAARANVKIRWVDSEEITPENVAEKLKGVDGILVPGGFGTRGTEGKIEAIRCCLCGIFEYIRCCCVNRHCSRICSRVWMFLSCMYL